MLATPADAPPSAGHVPSSPCSCKWRLRPRFADLALPSSSGPESSPDDSSDEDSSNARGLRYIQQTIRPLAPPYLSEFEKERLTLRLLPPSTLVVHRVFRPHHPSPRPAPQIERADLVARGGRCARIAPSARGAPSLVVFAGLRVVRGHRARGIAWGGGAGVSAGR